ncbi:hypothetical protein [Photobacterium lutimaris]|uniref:Uncharacterized protein n=1 Tax=Photobacterium lutimaris TaxID=388278 RepID=A0A2T3IYL4_9GAMM|nr:hypothetical protein [Photobacterium lutimaris]PSU33690.1 hypothetical protein C9I99_13050 [Photobacterium lutimaris]TDR74455.1 hypothetical protein DFP78_10742 [Photobacterium lutimaris]
MNYAHITELNELSEEAKAFLVYFVSQDLINVAEKLYFIRNDVPFGNQTIKYMTTFNNDLNGRIEYWIVFDNDQAAGVAQRLTYDDNFETSFIHFKINPEEDKYLAAKIASMPPVKMD